jgi:carboxypeptidase T
MDKAIRCFLAGLTLLCLPLLAGQPHAALGGAPTTGDGVVQILFTSPAELALLAQHLDIWEVIHALQDGASHDVPGAGTVVAWITTADAIWLAERGFIVEPSPLLTVQPATIPGTPCYRTVDELYAQLAAWAADYPTLTELYTVGDSYEGRPLLVMRLMRQQTDELERPVFFLMANIHGRELITPEVAMAFIALLLEGYGVDPDVTWLLDHHRIEVLVSANPDGHVRNETGYPWAYWRKNANPSYGLCGGTTFGIDLNRNSSFAWGGASSYPCAETYQGPEAVSETETQAVQALIRELFPDQREPAPDAAAPDDATGLFITLHSYSNLVLWPWGHTYTDAPNAAQLAQLGRKLASYNGYIAEQASRQLYLASGTTDDFAYGELGVAAYTFEIGSRLDGFYPPCSRYDALVQPNLGALLYAAKVARTPYLTPAGPDTLEVTALGVTYGEKLVLTVTAQVDDRQTGELAIAGAEVTYGVPPWEGGTAYPLRADDGAFDSAVESVSGKVVVTLPAPAAGAASGTSTAGAPLVFVRGRDAGGAWGPVSAAFVEIAGEGEWKTLYLPAVMRAEAAALP